MHRQPSTVLSRLVRIDGALFLDAYGALEELLTLIYHLHQPSCFTQELDYEGSPHTRLNMVSMSSGGMPASLFFTKTKPKLAAAASS